MYYIFRFLKLIYFALILFVIAAYDRQSIDVWWGHCLAGAGLGITFYNMARLCREIRYRWSLYEEMLVTLNNDFKGREHEPE